MRITFAFVLMALGVVPLRAQEEDLAARLKATIDARIQELRAELHARVDEALVARRAADALILVPASDEFRALYRLPAGCGWRVVGKPATASCPVQSGDVIVAIRRSPATAADEVAAAVLGETGELTLVRKGERLHVEWARKAEGADEMFERLWKKAVSEVIPAGGMVLTGAGGEGENPPDQKNPTPAKDGRR